MPQSTTTTCTPATMPLSGTRTTATTSATSTTSPVSGVRRPFARLFRRRRRPPDDVYRPRRANLGPFDHGSVDWRRMLMSVQRLG